MLLSKFLPLNSSLFRYLVHSFLTFALSAGFFFFREIISSVTNLHPTAFCSLPFALCGLSFVNRSAFSARIPSLFEICNTPRICVSYCDINNSTASLSAFPLFIAKLQYRYFSTIHIKSSSPPMDVLLQREWHMLSVCHVKTFDSNGTVIYLL